MRLIDYFDRGCEINPDGDCLVSDDDGSRHTYAEVREMTLKAAQALKAAGSSSRGKVLCSASTTRFRSAPRSR